MSSISQLLSAQAFAGEVDAVGVVDEAVQDRVGKADTGNWLVMMVERRAGAKSQ
jgi:hypothetical protein